MYLELHNAKDESRLNITINDIDHDHQAEWWVEESSNLDQDIVKWILYDKQGIRCVWEQPGTSITHRSERFNGARQS